MKIMERATMKLATACDGSPLLTTVIVMLFYVLVNATEALLETLIFGAPFEHWFDVAISCAAIGYAGYAIHCCAIYNTEKLLRELKAKSSIGAHE